MNTRQVKATVRGFAGRLEVETGKLIGNRTMQLRGIAKMLSARTERTVGDAAETIKAALRRQMRDAQNRREIVR